MVKDILVVGGGVVGLSAGLALAQKGLAVAVIDAASLDLHTPPTNPKIYAINAASERLFKQLNAWKNLDANHLSPYQHMHVWENKRGNFIDFDARMIAAPKLGTIIEDHQLRTALLTEIMHHNVALHDHAPVTAVNISADAITVHTQKGEIAGKLLIVADGALSKTRELLQIPLMTWPYHQHALIATVETEQPHKKTAFQVFTKEGTLAFLPLVASNQCTIVWSSSPKETTLRLNADEDIFNQQLSLTFEEKLGQIKLLSKRHSFPLQMRHVKQYAGDRFIIMGDAAHTIHPLAGLGLNVGLADLESFLARIHEDLSNIHTKRIRDSYARERTYQVTKTILLMEGIKGLFLNPLFPVATLRGWGFRLCNQLTPLKRFFIEQASRV